MKTLKTITLLFICCIFQGQVLAQGPPPFPPVPPAITEIMYNPPETGSDSLEFIEIRGGNYTENLTGWHFTSGIEFSFPDGFTLAPWEFVIISKDSVAFQNVFGAEAFQWENSSLLNTGEPIVIYATNGGGLYLADSITYDNSANWPEEANGFGSSMVLCGYHYSNENPVYWEPSQNNTGIVVNGITIYADPGEASHCLATAIAETAESAVFSIYPNPTNGEFEITLGELKEDTKVEVLDVSGKVVYSKNIDAGQHRTINVNLDLNSGIYILKAGENSARFVITK